MCERGGNFLRMREKEWENCQTSKNFEFQIMRESFTRLGKRENCSTIEGVCLFKGCHLFKRNFDPLERML